MAPKQKPGKSKQDYQTPPEFVEALLLKLNITNFTIDLAASNENTVTENGWYTKEQDSLKQNWSVYPGWAFCNPPYADITPWVTKAYAMSKWEGSQIAMLLPASAGANWWRDWVHNKAYVLFLNGRLTFVGQEDPYPKDCAVLLYTNYLQGGYDVWNWNTELTS